MAIIMYDGKAWTDSVDGQGTASREAIKQARAIVDKLEKDFGLLVTEKNPLCFDLSAPVWAFRELSKGH